METKKAYNKALKHILCCIIILIAFVITFTRVKAMNLPSDTVSSVTEDIVPLRFELNKDLLEFKPTLLANNNDTTYIVPKIVIKDANYYIKEYEKELVFFSDLFGYDIEDIKNDIKTRNTGNIELEPTNIASLKDDNGNIIVYSNYEYGIVEYFYSLVDSNELVRNRKLLPYEGNSDYVENLIMYYTNIYDNVDRSIALSIGAAESGYYQVKYMLRYNNVYGGMSKSGLIRHDNIELGVLNYVRLLSRNYFGKGLDTVGEIGYIYCPTVDDNGNKIASSHWIGLVRKAQSKYDLYTQDITIDDIINY